MKTIKELHGDLFEEGTQFRIADNFGIDPDAVWISRQDFEMLKARPVDMLSRTCFLFYGDDIRKRIVTIDPELLQGQLKLNMEDYGDFVARDDAYWIKLFKPHQLILEQYLVFEQLSCTNPLDKKLINGIIMHFLKNFSKLLLFCCYMFTLNRYLKHLQNNRVCPRTNEDDIKKQLACYTIHNPELLKEQGIDKGHVNMEMIEQYSMELYETELLRWSVTFMLHFEISAMDSRHWNELRELREDFERQDMDQQWKMLEHFSKLLDYWEEVFVPFIESWKERWRTC